MTETIWESIAFRLRGHFDETIRSTRYVTMSLPSKSSLDSRIVSSLPSIFSNLGWKNFRLLYRGSRNGLNSPDFHKHCDGHSNTLIIIADTNGYQFGGFTPVVWETGNSSKKDESVKSFIFTLKNPHGLSAQIFRLKSKSHAICCCCYISSSFPGFAFGGGHDMGVCRHCNTEAQSYTNFGISYDNNTGVAGQSFFTGSRNFTVQEIEVVEINK
jgi:hypothetical protein